MIALPRLSVLRPVSLRLPLRVRAALAWGSRWLGLGLALGALTDLVVRFSLPG